MILWSRWKCLLNLLLVLMNSDGETCEKTNDLQARQIMARNVETPVSGIKTKRRRQDCGKIEADGNEHDINCLDKFTIREPSDCVEKPGDTQSIYRET